MKIGTALLMAGCSKPQPPRRMPPVKQPNIIVFHPDALRAGSLGCYGNSTVTSPVIDRFSQEGILFEHCYSQASWTKPSVASLFTGYLPPVHQAVITDWDVKNVTKLRVQVLRDKFTTVAQTLQASGYNTGYYAVNPHVQKECGFARGFDRYIYKPRQIPDPMFDVMRWLGKLEEPFFAFIHGLDPHGPYTPTDRNYRKLFDAKPKHDLAALEAKDKEILETIKHQYAKGAEKPPMDELSKNGSAYLLRLYDAEIRNVDDQFEHLLAFLNRNGVAQRTIAALVSDHGEAFGEHGHFLHGNTLNDEEIHVPLLLRGPGLEPGLRVPWSAAQFDLGPTLVTLAGAKPPAGIQARSLFDAHGALTLDDDRPVFSYLDHENPDPNAWEAAVVQGRLKIIVKNQAKEYEGFNLGDDAGEKTNLLKKGTPPAELKALKTLLLEERKKHMALSQSFGEAEWTQPDESMTEQLQAIGYL